MAIVPGQLWEPDIGTFVCFLIECSVYCCIKRVADPLVNECTSCFLYLIIYCHTTGITLMRENVYNLEFSNFPESGDFLITGMCKMRFREKGPNACLFQDFNCFRYFY